MRLAFAPFGRAISLGVVVKIGVNFPPNVGGVARSAGVV
jgi:hypothetical protein